MNGDGTALESMGNTMRGENVAELVNKHAAALSPLVLANNGVTKKRKNFSTYTLPMTSTAGQTTYLENTLKLRKLHKTKVFMNPQLPSACVTV